MTCTSKAVANQTDTAAFGARLLLCRCRGFRYIVCILLYLFFSIHTQIHEKSPLHRAIENFTQIRYNCAHTIEQDIAPMEWIEARHSNRLMDEIMEIIVEKKNPELVLVYKCCVHRAPIISIVRLQTRARLFGAHGDTSSCKHSNTTHHIDLQCISNSHEQQQQIVIS